MPDFLKYLNNIFYLLLGGCRSAAANQISLDFKPGFALLPATSYFEMTNIHKIYFYV